MIGIFLLNLKCIFKYYAQNTKTSTRVKSFYLWTDDYFFIKLIRRSYLRNFYEDYINVCNITCKYTANLLPFSRGCREIPRRNCFETMRSRFLFPHRKKPDDSEKMFLPTFRNAFVSFFFFYFHLLCFLANTRLRVSIVYFFFLPLWYFNF